MTKAEEILEKHLKNNLDQRLYLRSSMLTYNLCLDALNEAINYTRCSTELNTSFKKGEKVIACNKLEGTVVSSETRTMVKVKIKGTTIGINARSLELKSI